MFASQVLATIEAMQLPGLAVPPGVLESGKKSFTVQPKREDMAHLKPGDTVKSIEVKFFPYHGLYVHLQSLEYV